jgi:hypothetical protein
MLYVICCIVWGVKRRGNKSQRIPLWKLNLFFVCFSSVQFNGAVVPSLSLSLHFSCASLSILDLPFLFSFLVPSKSNMRFDVDSTHKMVVGCCTPYLISTAGQTRIILYFILHLNLGYYGMNWGMGNGEWERMHGKMKAFWIFNEDRGSFLFFTLKNRIAEQEQEEKKEKERWRIILGSA